MAGGGGGGSAHCTEEESFLGAHPSNKLQTWDSTPGGRGRSDPCGDISAPIPPRQCGGLWRTIRSPCTCSRWPPAARPASASSPPPRGLGCQDAAAGPAACCLSSLGGLRKGGGEAAMIPQWLWVSPWQAGVCGDLPARATRVPSQTLDVRGQGRAHGSPLQRGKLRSRGQGLQVSEPWGAAGRWWGPGTCLLPVKWGWQPHPPWCSALGVWHGAQQGLSSGWEVGVRVAVVGGARGGLHQATGALNLIVRCLPLPSDNGELGPAQVVMPPDCL